jgi:hypothetical protein
MKKLVSLSHAEILPYILNSKELSEKFEERICDCEMSYLEEKLNCFINGSVNYCYGVYNNNNYFRVVDNFEFLNGVQNCINMYGASLIVENKFEQCKKLVESNLFDYHIKELGRLFFKEEILKDIEYLEDISYKITNKECDNQLLIDRVEDFIDEIEDVYINSENKLCTTKYL